MRVLRPFVWAAVLVAAFLYVTSVGHWNVSRLLQPVRSGAHAWEEPASAASGFSPDEQNNIDIYKSAREATVNVTSKVYRQDWFFQIYPSEGTGSGFILNPARRNPHQQSRCVRRCAVDRDPGGQEGLSGQGAGHRSA